MNRSTRRPAERTGPVNCPQCGRSLETMKTLNTHLKNVHPGLGLRERSLLLDKARFAIGWDPVRREGFGRPRDLRCPAQGEPDGDPR